MLGAMGDIDSDVIDSDVLVAGGGIAGLAAAYALARRGRRVRVLERAPGFTEVGAGLQLGPNATRILRDWGLLDEIIARGVLPRRLVLKDAVDGAELTSLELGPGFLARYGAPYVVIHRSDLLTILYDACAAAGVELLAEHDAGGLSLAAGHAGLRAAGRTHRAGVVLGADGLWSSLRGELVGDEPIGSGFVAYRGTREAADAAGADPDAFTDMVMNIGPGRHLVQYPLRQGELLNTVAVFASPAHARGEPEWGGPEELDAAFAGSCATVRRGLEFLWRDRRWPMFDRPPTSTWVRGRFGLIGDAAHPMLQYLAQGACQAFEDAACLAELTGDGPADWPAALGQYQRIRAPRTARVQTTARIWGDIWHCDGLTRMLRNALLTDRRLDDYRYIDWLYQP
jgi:salicylate hydroxylase